MVSSLDGFIAKKDNSVSWMMSTDKYEKGITLSKEEIEEYVKGIDCYVMGSGTYEQALVLGWPYGEKPVIVLTHYDLVSERENVKFYSGDLLELVNKQLRPIYQNIWMVGGALTAKSFIRLKLVDEIILSIIPIILGDGIPLFDYIGVEKALHLKDVTAFKDGMVELSYEVKNDL